MIRDARQDRVCSIDLLQGNNQSQFVLKGEGAERPQHVGALAHAFGEPIWPAYEKSADFSRIAFDLPYLFREGAACEVLPSLVEYQTKAPLATIKQLAGLAKRVGRLDECGIHRGKAP